MILTQATCTQVSGDQGGEQSRGSVLGPVLGPGRARLLCASHVSETLLLVPWGPSSVGHRSPDPQGGPGTLHILCFLPAIKFNS